MGSDMLRPTVMVLVVMTFAVVVKGLIDYLSRRQLMSRGVAPEDLAPTNAQVARWHLMSNLKWALICLGFGTGVLIYDRYPDVFSMTGGFGLMFVGTGLGYLIYFIVAWRWSTKETHEKTGNHHSI